MEYKIQHIPSGLFVRKGTNPVRYELKEKGTTYHAKNRTSIESIINYFNTHTNGIRVYPKNVCTWEDFQYVEVVDKFKGKVYTREDMIIAYKTGVEDFFANQLNQYTRSAEEYIDSLNN